MELSLDDLELINALQIAPRASWKALGGILKRHSPTLSSRWDQLCSQGLAWTTAHLTVDPVQSCMAFVQVRLAPDGEQSGIEALCAIPEVQTVDNLTPDGNYRLIVVTPDWGHLRRTVLPRIEAIEQVKHTVVSLATRLFASGGDWRLDALSPSQIRSLQSLNIPVTRPPSNPPESFWRMLRVLARDGRASSAEIAAAAQLHPTTACRHLNSFLASGTLVVRCEVAIEYTSHPIAVQWFARVPADKLEAAAAHLGQYRTLRLCAATTGETNLMFMMQVRQPSDIADIERRLHAAIPGAVVTGSHLATKTPKRMGWMIAPDGRAAGQVVA